MNDFISNLFTDYVKSGSSVIDPFAEQGRVLLAASRINRSAVGFFDKQEDISVYRSKCRQESLKEQLFLYTQSNKLETEYPNDGIDFVITTKIPDVNVLFRTCSAKLKIGGMLIVIFQDTTHNNLVVPALPELYEHSKLYSFELLDLQTNPLKKGESSVKYEYAAVFRKVITKNLLTPQSTKNLFLTIPNFRNSVFSETLEKLEHVIKKDVLRMYHKFKIAGMNKNEEDRKIVAWIIKHYVDEPPKVRLVHKPFISADGKNNDPNAVSVRVFLDKYKKWVHIGWIPKFNDDRSTPGPNKIVADWLDAENNPIKTVKLAELSSFRSNEGELLYFGVLLVVAETKENW